MSRKPITKDLAGLSLGSKPISWNQKDVMLYALGVGSRPDEDLEYVYEGRGPKVLPTYGVIPGGLAILSVIENVEIELAMLLHGEEAITLHREIPPLASAVVKCRITEVYDKGKAALIGCEGLVEDDKGPICTAKSMLFVRGAGGFGGERGPSTAGVNAPPDRAPDIVAEYQTRPEQGAVYRLSGDMNPIHIDPDFAKFAGFENPFMHGLCTFSVVGRAILRELCGGVPTRLKTLEGRFADQVYYGNKIITKMWKTGPGEAIVQAETQKGNIVLSQARTTYTS